MAEQAFALVGGEGTALFDGLRRDPSARVVERPCSGRRCGEPRAGSRRVHPAYDEVKRVRCEHGEVLQTDRPERILPTYVACPSGALEMEGPVVLHPDKQIWR